MRAAFNESLPLIYQQENGFTDLAKPEGKRMEACAGGQLLILAPWEHHNEKKAIRLSFKVAQSLSYDASRIRNPLKYGTPDATDVMFSRHLPARGRKFYL